MNLMNSLPTPGNNIHPNLYLHRNVPLENVPPQAPPGPLQQHDRKKRNILNIAGKKFLSLLGTTKNLKLKQKRADTPIPALLPSPILEWKSTSTGLCTGKDLVGQGHRFRLGLIETAINADKFSLRVKKWRPVLEVIPEEREEKEEEKEGEKEDQKESERKESEGEVGGRGVQ
ncbi:hypothetical protein B9Z19DRAFT_1069792 [Tuber borchii]|uniref:Uncharacterized protein n=1 Tax=Tuber borchii TaxID=42251 RepID=A0A2T6ZA76_TUBBO|nr:hypothetical protein B9Z19DRAFT_1069792 [Tuber borchii]